jgi:hypothetical protein
VTPDGAFEVVVVLAGAGAAAASAVEDLLDAVEERLVGLALSPASVRALMRSWKP